MMLFEWFGTGHGTRATFHDATPPRVLLSINHCGFIIKLIPLLIRASHGYFLAGFNNSKMADAFSQGTSQFQKVWLDFCFCFDVYLYLYDIFLFRLATNCSSSVSEWQLVRPTISERSSAVATIPWKIRKEIWKEIWKEIRTEIRKLNGKKKQEKNRRETWRKIRLQKLVGGWGGGGGRGGGGNIWFWWRNAACSVHAHLSNKFPTILKQICFSFIFSPRFFFFPSFFEGFLLLLLFRFSKFSGSFRLLFLLLLSPSSPSPLFDFFFSFKLDEPDGQPEVNIPSCTQHPQQPPHLIPFHRNRFLADWNYRPIILNFPLNSPLNSPWGSSTDSSSDSSSSSYWNLSRDSLRDSSIN